MCLPVKLLSGASFFDIHSHPMFRTEDIMLSAESAVYLVKDPVLRQFLLSRTHVMGYLCNIPDTHWKGMSPDLTKHGNPPHFGIMIF